MNGVVKQTGKKIQIIEDDDLDKNKKTGTPSLLQRVHAKCVTRNMTNALALGGARACTLCDSWSSLHLVFSRARSICIGV